MNTRYRVFMAQMFFISVGFAIGVGYGMMIAKTIL